MRSKVFKFTVLFLLTILVMSCTGVKFATGTSEQSSETPPAPNEQTICPVNKKADEKGHCVPITTGVPTNTVMTPQTVSTPTTTQTSLRMPAAVNLQPAATPLTVTTPAVVSAPMTTGCNQKDHFTWGRMLLDINNRCSATLPQLKEGESQLVQSESPNPGFIKVSCVNSKYVLATEPGYASHTDNDWQRYQVKIFFGESIDIACHNDKILFQQPRLWESCDTSSSALCFAALGNSPTETSTCWATKIYMDDQGIYKTTLVNGRTIGQNFNTQYRISIKTSKDNFAASYDITDDIRLGYGQAMNSAQPQDLYNGRPAGFSFVARKDMAGHQIKVFVEAKSFLNGQVKQTFTGETLIKVRENTACANNYDGTGVANFAIGNSLANESQPTMVRRGYPWPLHK